MATQQKVQLLMPEMGESVTEGTVLEWHVSEGDSGEEGDTMGEGSADKVDAEGPAPAPGTVPKILVQPDEEIEVGKPMAEIDPNGGPPEASEEAPAEEAQEGGEPAEEAAAETNGSSAEAEATPETDGKATTDDASVSAGKELEGGGLEIVMPEMGESVTEGTILEWHVAEGDQVAEGDTVVEVSTDKVDAEVPAPANGTITRVLVQPDETVSVGQVLAEMSAGGAAAAAGAGGGGAPAGAPPRAAAAASAGSEGPQAEAPPVAPAVAPEGDGHRASPVARRVAAKSGVDLDAVRGSGPGGKVTKADVLAAANGEQSAAASAPAAPS